MIPFLYGFCMNRNDEVAVKIWRIVLSHSLFERPIFWKLEGRNSTLIKMKHKNYRGVNFNSLWILNEFVLKTTHSLYYSIAKRPQGRSNQRKFYRLNVYIVNLNIVEVGICVSVEKFLSASKSLYIVLFF